MFVAASWYVEGAWRGFNGVAELSPRRESAATATLGVEGMVGLEAESWRIEDMPRSQEERCVETFYIRSRVLLLLYRVSIARVIEFSIGDKPF